MRSGVAALLAGLSIGTSETVGTFVEPDSTLVDRVVYGRSLVGNRLGETAARKVSIYLPPRYGEKPYARYPVVYLLSGLGGDHRNFTREGTPNRLGRLRSPQVDIGLDLKATADALIASGEIPEAILVGVSGLNTYANHWFACSETIGDYRSWVTRDIVGFVDREYRTRRDRRRRAILGHSSGAFGALSIALEYPETFGAVAALSPAGNDFEAAASGGILPRLIDLFFAANPVEIGAPVTMAVDAPIPDATFAALWGRAPGAGSFVTNVVYSAGAAFSSNLTNRPLLFDFPFVYPQKAVLPNVLARWAEADLVSQVHRSAGSLEGTPVYLARGVGPTVLHPEVGDIPLLRDTLIENGIVHTYDELPGDHFTSLPQSLRNALVFVLNSPGSIRRPSKVPPRSPSNPGPSHAPKPKGWSTVHDTSAVRRTRCRFDEAFSADAGQTWELSWIATETRRSR